MNGISPIRLPVMPELPIQAPTAANTDDVFAQAFAHAVNKVEGFQLNAKTAIDQFLSGEGEELHKIALDAQQAQLSFDLFLQVRNKVVAAYQEIMRMQV